MNQQHINDFGVLGCEGGLLGEWFRNVSKEPYMKLAAIFQRQN